MRYAVKHGVCESICVLVGFLHIALTDFFLNKAFSNLGPEVGGHNGNYWYLSKVVANLSGADVHNPLARTFPIVTSCNLRQVRFRLNPSPYSFIHFPSLYSLAVGAIKQTLTLCAFFRTTLCTRSSISSSGFGSLPSPSSPSYISSIGQHSIKMAPSMFPELIFVAANGRKKNFLVAYFFRKQLKIYWILCIFFRK